MAPLAATRTPLVGMAPLVGMMLTPTRALAPKMLPVRGVLLAAGAPRTGWVPRTMPLTGQVLPVWQAPLTEPAVLT
ncbi:hypothetical protein MXD59_12085 [Frankia sp. Ag45/Mut15]|uniref:Secreted protein n=1 Tax=Frankia umida TaxID=573489 RepID=A0ABT0JYY9_9ACTN|nr:hypothetical protein [Frankia umida]MCK9876504.1 hypothetical protein [Frankia umida]